jgi:hypothetical protein
MEYSKKSK